MASEPSAFLNYLSRRPVCFDGGMGSSLYEKGYFINRAFDEANAIEPDKVRAIHEEMIAAGANVIQTNTFSANRIILARYGIPEKVREVNRLGVEIARSAAKGKPNVFVAGSVGPTGEGLGYIDDDKAALITAALEEQITELVAAGVDLLALESFHSLHEMHLALLVARKHYGGCIVAQMSFGEEKTLRDGSGPARVAVLLESWGADVIGVNCSLGPALIYDVVELFMKDTKLPVIVQPNAGNPRQIDARFIYQGTPEYFGVYARRFLKAGVRCLGGCCGCNAAHIASISAAVKMFSGGVSDDAAAKERSMSSARRDSGTDDEKFEYPSGVEPVPLGRRSKLAAKISTVFRERLANGTRRQAPLGPEDFVVSVEVNPPSGLDLTKPLSTVRMLRAAGVDVINIADGPRASVRMSNTAFGNKVMQETGSEVIIHLCCRDRNLLGLQSDVLGNHVSGFRNMVVITGDPPKMGDYPKATAVFDMDSVQLLHLVNGLNWGIDPAGKVINGERTEFFLACGAEPGAVDYVREIKRVKAKIKAGASLIMTQPVYDRDVVERFLDSVEPLGVPVLLGLCPLVSHRNAQFLHNEVPGMSIPESIRQRMEKAGQGQAAKDEGVRIAKEMLNEFKDRVVGCYIMPQLGQYALAVEVLKEMGYGGPDAAARRDAATAEYVAQCAKNPEDATTSALPEIDISPNLGVKH